MRCKTITALTVKALTAGLLIAGGKLVAPAREAPVASGTAAVGSYAPNAWGLYDMHGNVWECCLDLTQGLLQGGTNPVGGAEGATRVLRGGGWGTSPGACRSGFRHSYNKSKEAVYSGLRVVANLVPMPLDGLQKAGTTFKLWDESLPAPRAEELQHPAGQLDQVVHRADEEYRFLHDNAIVWHDGEIVAGWYNCPLKEMQEASCIRARRSRDGCRTWSAPEIVADDRAGKKILYVPVVFLSQGERLLAFVSNMTGADLVTQLEVFAHDKKQPWRSLGIVAGPFLPNAPPVLMDNGNYIMAGRMAAQPASRPEIPAVAISDGRRVDAPWRLVPMTSRQSARPHTNFPESSVWVDGARVTALVRGRLIFTSPDHGETWAGPFASNLPAVDSKLFALRLSTGQRCLILNYPPRGKSNARDLLVVAVSRPHEDELSAMWKLRDGFAAKLATGPQWSYPYAIEHDGRLYVIYTSEKKHSVLSIVPLESLRLP